jgi:hypothetical protein
MPALFFERVTAIEPANQTALQRLEQLDGEGRDVVEASAEGTATGPSQQKTAFG